MLTESGAGERTKECGNNPPQKSQKKGGGAKVAQPKKIHLEHGKGGRSAQGHIRITLRCCHRPCCCQQSSFRVSRSVFGCSPITSVRRAIATFSCAPSSRPSAHQVAQFSLRAAAGRLSGGPNCVPPGAAGTATAPLPLTKDWNRRRLCSLHHVWPAPCRPQSVQQPVACTV